MEVDLIAGTTRGVDMVTVIVIALTAMADEDTMATIAIGITDQASQEA